MRNVLISISIAIMILTLYVTGILQGWLDNIEWGIVMFFQIEFYEFLFIMILVIGVITMLIRQTINWGGA